MASCSTHFTWCLRKIMGLTLKDKVTKFDVLKRSLSNAQPTTPTVAWTCTRHGERTLTKGFVLRSARTLQTSAKPPSTLAKWPELSKHWYWHMKMDVVTIPQPVRERREKRLVGGSQCIQDGIIFICDVSNKNCHSSIGLHSHHRPSSRSASEHNISSS